MAIDYFLVFERRPDAADVQRFLLGQGLRTADGKLLSCLFDTEYYDLKPIIRAGGDDKQLAAFIKESVWKKPKGVGYMPWIKEGWKNPRNMNAIGG